MRAFLGVAVPRWLGAHRARAATTREGQQKSQPENDDHYRDEDKVGLRDGEDRPVQVPAWLVEVHHCGKQPSCLAHDGHALSVGATWSKLALQEVTLQLSCRADLKLVYGYAQGSLLARQGNTNARRERQGGGPTAQAWL